MKKTFLSKLKPFLGTFQLHLDENTEFDYFIVFKNADNISLKVFNQMGRWTHYGQKSVRGWSSLSKEQIKAFVVEHLNCKDDEFKVFNAHNELFRMRF